MDGFFRILEKRLSELICTRLYITCLLQENTHSCTYFTGICKKGPICRQIGNEGKGRARAEIKIGKYLLMDRYKKLQTWERDMSRNLAGSYSYTTLTTSLIANGMNIIIFLYVLRIKIFLKLQEITHVMVEKTQLPYASTKYVRSFRKHTFFKSLAFFNVNCNFGISVIACSCYISSCYKAVILG